MYNPARVKFHFLKTALPASPLICGQGFFLIENSPGGRGKSVGRAVKSLLRFKKHQIEETLRLGIPI
jgi:hypothetical protein